MHILFSPTRFSTWFNSSRQESIYLQETFFKHLLPSNLMLNYSTHTITFSGLYFGKLLVLRTRTPIHRDIRPENVRGRT